MSCHYTTDSENSNVLYKKLVSSFIVASLLVCLCVPVGATPAEGDIDLYKGVIGGYAIVAGMQFYSWREVYQFSEDFFHRITTEQTPEQLNFISKISYTDFEEFDFYFLKFNSRPDVLSAFVSALESTYDIELNPASVDFTESFNIPKLLAMPAYYSAFDTSIGSNSSTDFGIIYNLGNNVSVSNASQGLNLISTNNRGVSFYLYKGIDSKFSFFFKLGEYYIKVHNTYDLSNWGVSYVYPSVIFRNNGKVLPTDSDTSGRGVVISQYSPTVSFPTTFRSNNYGDTIEGMIGDSYGAATFGYAMYDSNGYLVGFSYLQRHQPTNTYFAYNTDPAALHEGVSLGIPLPFFEDRYYFESFLTLIQDNDGENQLTFDINMRDVYLYNSAYSFAPINYDFNTQIKIPSNLETLHYSSSTPSSYSRYIIGMEAFIITLLSHSLGLSEYVIGTQIQGESNIIFNRSYLADSNSLYNQLLTEEKVIRVPYNLLQLDTDHPDLEITPTPPSIEDTDKPIGDISDSSQQVGDNLNGTSDSIGELGDGLLVPDIDLDGTLGNIPDDGNNSVSTFISLVMAPLMDYPIVTTLLLCLVGFTSIKLILYGTGRD